MGRLVLSPFSFLPSLLPHTCDHCHSQLATVRKSERGGEGEESEGRGKKRRKRRGRKKKKKKRKKTSGSLPVLTPFRSGL